jgi:hypothetical protein
MAAGRVKGTKKMQSGKRSPTAHRTLEQAQAQSSGYEAQPKRKKYRAELGKLRRQKGLKVGDGKEVSHKTAGSKGGAHSMDNTTVKSRKANREEGTGSSKTKARDRIRGK